MPGEIKLKQLTVQEYSILARKLFLIIRNLSYYRGTPPKPKEVLYNLGLIGRLSDAMHNLPLTDNDTFLSELVRKNLTQTIQDYPELKNYLSDYLLT